MLRPDYVARSPRPGSLSPAFTIASKRLANPDAAPVQPPVEAGTMTGAGAPRARRRRGSGESLPVPALRGRAAAGGIARALVADPPVFIVDEPTSNLDRRTADAIIELLTSIRAAGRGLLVASHDAHLIARAGRVVPLDD